MRLQEVLGSLALSGAAVAFSDATPWILYSTASFATPNSKQLQTSSDVLKNTKDILSGCPTDRYVFATLPGMNAADFHGANMPAFKHSVANDHIQGKYIISEVVGDIMDGNLVNLVKTACSARGKEAAVEQVSLNQLPYEDRAEALLANDRILGEYISDGKSLTVLFYATRPEPAYEAEFSNTFHQDLRRATHDDKEKPQVDNRPLFEKYQFFTPGIFMGLIAATVLFSILGVGIRALGSLEVPYGAFEKEMGPAAQKKQQ